MKTQLLVVCDGVPVPPLNGHTRKVYDMIKAVCDQYSISVFVYGDEAIGRSVQEHWRGSGVQWTFEPKRGFSSYFGMLAGRVPLPTARRNFNRELSWVKEKMATTVRSVLFIDFINGSPLAANFKEGVVISGHDCMSHLFRQERIASKSVKQKLHFTVREYLVRTLERKFAHRCQFLHLVSSEDAERFRRVNPAINPSVIPIGGPKPSPTSLRGWDERSGGIIWGNLNSQPIADGLVRLLPLFKDKELSGWQLIGSVAPEVVQQRFPEVYRVGLSYHPRVPDISTCLGEARYLFLPDTTGTGQKNRCVDGLAHGCCVFGLPEVFRGMGAEKCYVCEATFELLVSRLRAAVSNQEDMRGVASNGANLFLSEFSSDVLREKWVKLFDFCASLTLNER